MCFSWCSNQIPRTPFLFTFRKFLGRLLKICKAIREAKFTCFPSTLCSLWETTYFWNTVIEYHWISLSVLRTSRCANNISNCFRTLLGRSFFQKHWKQYENYLFSLVLNQYWQCYYHLFQKEECCFATS